VKIERMKDLIATSYSHGFRTEIKASSDEVTRIVVVRYFLDRPGYDLENSSSRLWKNPPATCAPADIAGFLREQGIRDETDKKLLVELYLDTFHSYMLLEVCAEDGIVFNFTGTTVQEPGILNIRLTDSGAAEAEKSNSAASAAPRPQYCNTSPVGLFAFSMTVALETADLFGRLVVGTVDQSFVLVWGPYAFFVSGLLQLIVGLWEVTRNNIYGATAFMGFGCFWLANGLKLILLNYFPDEIPPELLGSSDPTGECIRNLWLMAFVCVLFKQTLVMNKLSSILIGLLVGLLFATAIAGWSLAMEWIQLIMGILVSTFAFYVFTAEFTNEVYHREVFNMHAWSAESPEEIFGAPGRKNKLQVKAVELRTAHPLIDKKKSVHNIRSVRPTSGEK
jgi:succinate-acetate transporter protein